MTSADQHPRQDQPHPADEPGDPYALYDLPGVLTDYHALYRRDPGPDGVWRYTITGAPVPGATDRLDDAGDVVGIRAPELDACALITAARAHELTGRHGSDIRSWRMRQRGGRLKFVPPVVDHPGHLLFAEPTVRQYEQYRAQQGAGGGNPQGAAAFGDPALRRYVAGEPAAEGTPAARGRAARTRKDGGTPSS